MDLGVRPAGGCGHCHSYCQGCHVLPLHFQVSMLGLAHVTLRQVPFLPLQPGFLACVAQCWLQSNFLEWITFLLATITGLAFCTSVTAVTRSELQIQLGHIC